LKFDFEYQSLQWETATQDQCEYLGKPAAEFLTGFYADIPTKSEFLTGLHSDIETKSEFLNGLYSDILTSVADPGCLSRIRIFSVPDPS
jgi:hypothetical protein